MNAVVRSFAVGGGVAALALATAGTGALAQEGFDDGSLKGVYAIYLTDASMAGMVGVVEYDAEGGIVAGSGSLVLPGPESLEPGDPLLVAPFEVDPAASSYRVDPAGTGTALTVVDIEGVPGLERLGFGSTFVITVAKKDTGVAEEYRFVGTEVSPTGQVSSGYGQKLPASIVGSLEELPTE